MKITMRAEGEHLVIGLEGDLVASSVETLMHAWRNAEDGGPGGGVLLDLSDVRFMDSMGLLACMEIQKGLHRHGRRLVCCCAGDGVLKAFRITGADKRVKLARTEAEGLALLDRKEDVLDRAVFSIMPHFGQVDAVRERLAAFCERVYRGRDVGEALGDLTLASTEAMNNAVEHSRAPKVDIELKALQDGVVFSMSTEGEMFDPTRDVAMPSMDDGEDLPEGGFGRAIIMDLMDEVMYEYRDGKNLLTLTYKFKHEAEEA